jgi:hypothetical protein
LWASGTEAHPEMTKAKKTNMMGICFINNTSLSSWITCVIMNHDANF